MKITNWIVLKIKWFDLEDDNNLDCEPVEWLDILEKHFSNENDDINVSAEDLYVKSESWKIIKISAVFWDLIYTLIKG